MDWLVIGDCEVEDVGRVALTCPGVNDLRMNSDLHVATLCVGNLDKKGKGVILHVFQQVVYTLGAKLAYCWLQIGLI